MSWELSAGESDERGSGGEASPGVIFDVLGSERRRIVLSVLRDRKGAMDERKLAEEVARREGNARDQSEIDRVRTTLAHAHLPKLERADLVRRGPEGRVALAPDCPVRSPRFQVLLRTAGAWDADVDVLSDRRRREILSVLTEGEQQVDLETLARRLAAEASTDDVDGVRVSLHHVHLPKLDSAGVVDYDPERKTVAYEGLPSIYESWLSEGGLDELPQGPEGADA